MVRAVQSVTLNVLMNGYSVGYLHKSPSGSMSFRYDKEWLLTESTRPISLSLPLTNKNYEDERVYNFFDNLLPDNKNIRSKIQSRFKISTNQPFDLLRAIGADCVGAIQICENQQPIPDIKTITAKPLSPADIAKILTGYQHTPLGMFPLISNTKLMVVQG
jgi:serine/threonine-protein kinase HipA